MLLEMPLLCMHRPPALGIVLAVAFAAPLSGVATLTGAVTAAGSLSNTCSCELSPVVVAQGKERLLGLLPLPRQLVLTLTPSSLALQPVAADLLVLLMATAKLGMNLLPRLRNRLCEALGTVLLTVAAAVRAFSITILLVVNASLIPPLFLVQLLPLLLKQTGLRGLPVVRGRVWNTVR